MASSLSIGAAIALNSAATSTLATCCRPVERSPVSMFRANARKFKVRAAASSDNLPSASSTTVSGESEPVSNSSFAQILPSGEWPENFSMLNFEDLSAHYEPILFKKEAQPATLLADVMTKKVWMARELNTMGEIEHHFDHISGLPVVDENQVCIGVVSKKDRSKSDLGDAAKVGDVMNSPAITLSADKTVLHAAALMLKKKIHRIPVINEVGQLVGIVTRTDIFEALEQS
eukprot:TRINITY_DN176_c0_g1_i1.p1 TRINITY_DN176_c0_g1~~TRINITY_DN176_c0_g1_i1.p1  ORF type:complete len:244 (-),score=32.51 TRINITY_DN176_c0_g1_i1:295-987(-)